MKIRVPLVYAFLVSTLFALGLSACENTVRGVGRDINDTAEAVEDSTSSGSGY